MPRLAGPRPEPLAAALAVLDPVADHALRQRLQLLRDRVRGPWRTAAAPPPAEGETIAGANGQPLGQLWIGPDQITWQGSDGRVWRAGLAPP